MDSEYAHAHLLFTLNHLLSSASFQTFTVCCVKRLCMRKSTRTFSYLEYMYDKTVEVKR